MSYQTVRDHLVNVAGSTLGASVHTNNHDVLDMDRSVMFADADAGWKVEFIVTRIATQETQDEVDAQNAATHTFAVQAMRVINESGSSEVSFQKQIEVLRDAYRQQIADKFDDVTIDKVYPLQLHKFFPTVIMGLQVHLADMSIAITEREVLL